MQTKTFKKPKKVHGLPGRPGQYKKKKPCIRKEFIQPTKMENLVTWPKLILNKDHLVETFLGQRFITATY